MLSTFCFMLLVFTLNTSYAQQWISQGAEWHYSYSNISEGGYVHINYEKDTLIQGQSCQKLSLIKHRFGVTSPGGTIQYLGNSHLNPEFTYSRGDSVFHLQNGSFSLLYDFSASINDTWNLGTDSNSFNCGDSHVRVDSLSSSIHQNNTLKHLWLSDRDTNNSIGIVGEVVKGIGAVDQFLFASPRNCDPNIIIEFSTFNFRCFSSSTFPKYKKGNQACDYPLGVGLEENQNSAVVQVYPNPVQDQLFVKLSKPGLETIHIHDLLGQLIHESKNLELNEVIDISSFSPGTYLISIIGEKESFTKKFIKIP